MYLINLFKMSFRPKGEILKHSKIYNSFYFLEMIFALSLFFLQVSVYCQTDWVRWEKSDPPYQIKGDYPEREYDLSILSISDVIVKPVVNAYWFLISDVDGANCPFEPSCSSFFVKSVKETNIVQGALMFFDRFTRDTNAFGRLEHYPKYGKNHFYDPVSLYTLDIAKINYIPANSYLQE